MTELKLKTRLAQIVVYSHVGLFIYAFIIAQFGTFEGEDAAQLFLMGSPLLALVAIAAFRAVMGFPVNDATQLANSTKVQMSITVTVAFVVLLFVAYTITMLDTTISVPSIKFAVGIIETALGGYIGIVKDVFFSPEET